MFSKLNRSLVGLPRGTSHLTKRQTESLKEISKENDVFMAEIIRRALDEYLDRLDRKKRKEERKQEKNSDEKNKT